MAAHAILPASSSKMWLACTPSARLGLRFPETTSEAAEEGTHAHYISETMLRYHNEEISKAEHDYKIDAAKDHKLYKPEMIGHCGDYVDAVLSKMHADSILLIERKFTMSPFVPQGFGTGDATIITPSKKLLDFSDLKYGKGVPVSAINNTQLKLYGVGALIDLAWLFDIETVKTHIYQPRLDDHSEDEYQAYELMHWARTYVQPRAELAFKGEGELVPGDHCRVCKAAPRCRALDKYRLEMEALKFRDPFLLEDDELLSILEREDILVNWLNAVDDYIYAQALSGKKWEGYKLVEGKSNRIVKDPGRLIKTLKDAGFDKPYDKPKLFGIEKMQTYLGKTTFNLLVAPVLFKPPGKPALVKETDPRREWNKSSIFDDTYDDI